MLVTQKPTDLLISKEDLRQYCGITDTTDDATVTHMLKSAQLDSERILNRAVARQKRRLVVNALTSIFVIEPAVHVDSIKILDNAPSNATNLNEGAIVGGGSVGPRKFEEGQVKETIPSTDYTVFTEETLSRVLHKDAGIGDGASPWPAQSRTLQSYEINYTCGWVDVTEDKYGDTWVVPEPVSLMIAAQVKFYYEHRGEPFQKASKAVQSVIRHDLDLLAIASRYKFLGTELTERES